MASPRTKNVYVVVGIVIPVLLLVATGFYASALISGLTADKARLLDQATTIDVAYRQYMATYNRTETEYDALYDAYQTYRSTHYYTDTQYYALSSQYSTVWCNWYLLDAPKLSTLNLKLSDERPWLSDPYLLVSGEVWNVGNRTAYNCKIHVTLYQGSVTAKETDVYIGTIAGENKASVNQKVYYQGSQLTGWSYRASF